MLEWQGYLEYEGEQPKIVWLVGRATGEVNAERMRWARNALFLSCRSDMKGIEVKPFGGRRTPCCCICLVNSPQSAGDLAHDSNFLLHFDEEVSCLSTCIANILLTLLIDNRLCMSAR